MITLIDTIESKQLLEYYYSIEKEIIWLDSGPKGKQSGVQYLFNEDPFLSATGKGRFHDKMFNNLNSYYKDTIIEEIINRYQLYRTRWIWLNPFSCYSMHFDSSPRVHIPIITNQYCLFLFPPNQTFHLETGNVYKADTNKKHTFINCSTQPRLHLIGAVLS